MKGHDMTQKQAELKSAIESRGDFLSAKWWIGNHESRLYVECTRPHIDAAGNTVKTTKKSIYLTFDDAAECYGARVVGRCHPADRIAFYEALRIGNPDALAEYVKECENSDDWDGAPEEILAQ